MSRRTVFSLSCLERLNDYEKSDGKSALTTIVAMTATIVGIIFVVVLSVGCDHRSLGDDNLAADGGLGGPDSKIRILDAGPDVDGGSIVDAQSQRLVFLRGTEHFSRKLMGVVAADGEVFELNPDFPSDGGGVVDYVAGPYGVLFQEIGATGESRYKTATLEGEILYASMPASSSWETAHMGILNQGKHGWYLSEGVLNIVDLENGNTLEYSDPVVFCGDHRGTWLVVGERNGDHASLTGVHVTDGQVVVLDEINGLEGGDYGCVFNYENSVDGDVLKSVYLSSGWSPLYFLQSGQESVVLSSEVSCLLGRNAENDELVVQHSDGVVLMDPHHGNVTTPVSDADHMERLTLSPDGKWLAYVVQPPQTGQYLLEVVNTSNGSLQHIDLVQYGAQPWDCCCGGPTAGALIFDKTSQWLAVSVEYIGGMCACLCNHEVPDPATWPLEIVLMALPDGTVKRVPHNGACRPSFSADGGRLAFCDNATHTAVDGQGRNPSGVAIYDLSAETTVQMTDPQEYDFAVNWAR
jgi:hypothetical protein